MSKHFSWTKLNEAIFKNDTNKVEKALFILDDKIWQNPLDNDEAAITIAAELGRKEIVNLLIAHESLNGIAYSHKEAVLWNAFNSACQTHHFNVAESLLEYSILDMCPDISHQAGCVIQFGDINLLNTILDYVRQRAPPIWDQSFHSKLISSIACGAFTSGKSGIFSSDEIPSTMTAELMQYLKEKFHPLYVAILLNDQKSVRSLIKSDKKWHEGRGYQWNPIEFAAITGNVTLLKLLHKKLGHFERRDKLMESVCDMSCRHGNVDILKACIVNEWVDTSFHSRWKRRLRYSLKNRQSNTAMFLLHKFYLGPLRARRPSKIEQVLKFSPSVSDFTESHKEKQSLLDLSIINGQVSIVDSLMEYVATTSMPEVITKIASQCFHTAVKNGRSNMVRYFKEKFNAELPDNTCWCKMIEETSSVSLVVVEMMGKSCSCSGPISLNLATSSRLTVHLLQDVTYASEWQLVRSLTNCPADVDPINIRNKLWLSLDYVDINTFSDTTVSSVLRKNHFYQLCDFFRRAAASSPRNFGHTTFGLLMNVLYMNQESREIFIKCVNHSGFRIIDHKLVQFSPDLKLMPDYNEFLKLSKGASFKYRSLKSDCRIAVRRVIRANSPKICSLTDQILQLAIAGILPRSLVSYLLHRDERLSMDL